RVGDYLRFESELPGPVRELAILLVARRWSQPYEWNAHYAIALDAGLAQPIADAIAQDRVPDAMSAHEAAIFTFCKELLRDSEVGDAAYAQVQACFGERGVVDVTCLV